MFKDALEVGTNIMAYRKMKQRVEVDRTKVIEENQPSTSSSTDAKFDIIMKTMEILICILDIEIGLQKLIKMTHKSRIPTSGDLLPLKLDRESNEIQGMLMTN